MSKQKYKTEYVNFDLIKILYKGKTYLEWNNDAHFEYPEDLTWERTISAVFDAGIALGMQLEKDSNVVDEFVFELIDVLKGREIPNLHYQVCEDCKGKCRGHY